MTSTTFTVFMYFNGNIYVEYYYSDKYISSNTAWVIVTNTMSLSQIKHAILNHFNGSTLHEYEVHLCYMLPIFISGNIRHCQSCMMCGDDDIESIFYMGTTKACHLPIEIMTFITARHQNATLVNFCFIDVYASFNFNAFLLT